MTELPNTWPSAGIFSSTCHNSNACQAAPLVASGLQSQIGWQFWTDPKSILRAMVGSSPVVSRKHPDDYCFPDCWHCTVQAGECFGHLSGVFPDRSSMALLISFDDLPDDVFPELALDPPGDGSGNCQLVKGDGWWLAVESDEPGARRRFGIGLSSNNEEEAIERAAAARQVNVLQRIEKHRKFYVDADVPESVVGTKRRTYLRALGVQQSERPCPRSDTYQWCANGGTAAANIDFQWDHFVRSLGFVHSNVGLSENALHRVFNGQNGDGGLGLESAGKAGEVCLPPLAAWVVWRQYERTTRLNFVSDIYERLSLYLGWYEENRKTESGLYNWDDADDHYAAMKMGPRFGGPNPSVSVDLSCYMAAEYLYMAKMAKQLDKGEDAAKWNKEHARIRGLINEMLWDDMDQFYHDLDECGEFVPIKTSVGLLALHALVPDRNQAEALRMHIRNPKSFWLPLPLPHVAGDEVVFSDNAACRMVNPVLNLMVYYGLMSYAFVQEARELAHCTVTEITRCYAQYGCIYRYYDANSDLSPIALAQNVEKALGPGNKQFFGSASSASAFMHFVSELL